MLALKAINRQHAQEYDNRVDSGKLHAFHHVATSSALPQVCYSFRLLTFLPQQDYDVRLVLTRARLIAICRLRGRCLSAIIIFNLFAMTYWHWL
jgi:hypothetical protein